MHLEIELPRSVAHGKVLLDGKDISCIVRAVRIEAVVGELTKVELEVLPTHVSVRSVDPELHAKVVNLGTEIAEITSLADPVRAFIKHMNALS